MNDQNSHQNPLEKPALDYKHTLNLPHTDFPMKANLKEREPKAFAKWQSDQLYEAIREKMQGRPKFIFHDGPPYANGQIHIGHVVNKVLKDMVVKAKTLQGFDAKFIPGWDCHGLPIELNVEKKFGKPGVKLTVSEFQKACREYATSQMELQKQEFINLGILADFDHPYFTMDFKYEAGIIRTFSKLIQNGHLARGLKPVYWCLDCRSTLAEAEVEYQEKKSQALDVLFSIESISQFIDQFAIQDLEFISKLNQSSIGIIIWTTTAWTLPANEAVAVHPDLDYVLIQYQNQFFVIAQSALEGLQEKYFENAAEIKMLFKGKQLEHLRLVHPLIENKIVPVILGDHVTGDSGTGAVHTAPAHGLEDYQAGLAYRLPVNNPVNDAGVFIEGTPLVSGLSIKQANEKIIEQLIQNQKLLFQASISHSYPHCWRHKTPIIFRATPQWFISMEKNGLRQCALDQIEQVEWIPDWGKNRIKGMLAQRPDWCVSRQRLWGVPLGLFIHKETGEYHPRTVELLEMLAQRVEQFGIEVWQTISEEEFLGEDAKYYVKSKDTLDVWFDSGASHAIVLDEGVQADLNLEGSDQHRGWFHSSLLIACGISGVAPYKAVLTHGFTLDAHGRKMSKSLGNVISPEQIANKYGVDIMRLWVAMTDYRNDILVSDQTFANISENYRRIRNTLRFLLANLHDFDFEKDQMQTEKLLKLDQFVLHELGKTQTAIQKFYSEYQFNSAANAILNYCVLNGGFYLDIIKDRQYTLTKNHIARRSAQTVLFHMLQVLVRALAPIASFTAEEVWQCIPNQSQASVFLSDDWVLPEIKLSESESSFWKKINRIQELVNYHIEAKRKDKTLGSGLEAEVHLFTEKSLKNELDAMSSELKFIFISGQVFIHDLDQAPNDAMDDTVDGQSIRVMIQKSEHAKCTRCWHRDESVGKNDLHPELCARCENNIFGEGENRRWA